MRYSTYSRFSANIRGLYLAGVKDPKRLTFKGLQAVHAGR
jgi:hypothetical protein